eukprot:TRINITY_DN11836_c0_g1_i2.p1 TRINITY_DN11836_c0_g1~~TRINITY_DN11836_c0_g1_i2.p1  ORF type:complete len:492 (+),score=142.08 TRINITY_DN11836_c0_g1_i2:61-1476(+)
MASYGVGRASVTPADPGDAAAPPAAPEEATLMRALAENAVLHREIAELRKAANVRQLTVPCFADLAQDVLAGASPEALAAIPMHITDRLALPQLGAERRMSISTDDTQPPPPFHSPHRDRIPVVHQEEDWEDIGARVMDVVRGARQRHLEAEERAAELSAKVADVAATRRLALRDAAVFDGDDRGTVAGQVALADDGSGPAEPPPLPEGWKEYTLPDGRSYYHNEQMGKTQWRRPGGGKPYTINININVDKRLQSPGRAGAAGVRRIQSPAAPALDDSRTPATASLHPEAAPAHETPVGSKPPSRRPSGPAAAPPAAAVWHATPTPAAPDAGSLEERLRAAEAAAERYREEKEAAEADKRRLAAALEAERQRAVSSEMPSPTHQTALLQPPLNSVMTVLTAAADGSPPAAGSPQRLAVRTVPFAAASAERDPTADAPLGSGGSCVACGAQLRTGQAYCHNCGWRTVVGLTG